MAYLSQQLINALVVGSFYSLVALGYTMVYGIVRLINFAHGDIYMLGAFTGYLTLMTVGRTTFGSGLAGLLLAGIISATLVGLLGVVSERLAYRPLRVTGGPRISMLITAIGVSLVLQNGVLRLSDARNLSFPASVGQGSFQLLGAQITHLQVLMIATAVLLMVALHLFTQRTLMGKAMRAVALDAEATRLMGIDVDRVISAAFLVGSMLAAVAGVMFGASYGQIHFLMGFTMGLKAFTAAVLGGIGNIPGAMLGGLLLGTVETFAVGYLSSAWKDVVAFALLIVLLVFKPTGILGERIAERV